ncbi:hypothetical protein C8J31_11472 [Rhizobium sp. PP-CC-2G-626]|nr:hypothetical protein C8J31_11472 [Rhizobium sp. PP-CC-2G-626]
MARGSDTGIFLRQHGPMLLFALLTFLGVGFIWTAKLWELDTAFVTAVPITIMLVYLVMSLVAGSLRVHNEQAGDNLYYMGFLFTLSSLGVSLYRFTGDVSIDEIVRNFGIAVTSTICGIAFRILFNQMRRDPIEIERSVRHELAEMTRRVRTELDSSAREFSSYRRTSSQMLVEGFEEIALQAERTGEAVQKAIETLSRESLKPIQDAADKLALISEENLKLVEQRTAKATELADAATGKLNEATEKIAIIVGGLSASIEALTTNLSQMKMPDEIIRLEVRPILETVSEVAELQRQQAEGVVKSLDSQMASFLEAVKPVKDVPDQIALSLRPLADLSNSLQGSLTELARIPMQMESFTASVAEASLSIRDLASSRSAEEGSQQLPVKIRIGTAETDDVGGGTLVNATPVSASLPGSSEAAVPGADEVANDPGTQEPKRGQAPAESEDEDKPKRGWFRKW